jgi:hypothetical protein
VEHHGYLNIVCQPRVGDQRCRDRCGLQVCQRCAHSRYATAVACAKDLSPWSRAANSDLSEAKSVPQLTIRDYGEVVVNHLPWLG